MHRRNRFNTILNRPWLMNFNTSDDGGGGGGTGDGGEGGDGGGDAGGETKFTQADIDAAVNAARAEVDKVTSKNAQLLGEIKELKPLAAKLKDVDVDNLLNMKEQIEQNEVLKLLSEGKHDEAISKATERLEVTHTAEKTALQEQIDELQNARQSDRQVLETLLLDGGATQAFIEAGGDKVALDDAVSRARRVWSIGEDMKAEARDSDGNLMTGEGGALTWGEWAENLKKEAPHLFPRSQGGDLGGDAETAATGSLEAQMVKAAESNDFAKLRELRDKRNQGGRR